jgi:SpoIID/LytB domain protein
MRRAGSNAAAWACLVLALAPVAASATPPAGRDAGDTALEQASRGRTVRVRVAGRVEDLPTELYVARVVAAEGEPKAGDAAQEALAIAIRTFAAANSGRHRREGFDLCDATHCQVVREPTPASRRAALATAGRVLVYGGRPAEVFYSASCGGRSEAVAHVWPGAVDHPYLPSIEDDVHEGEPSWVVDLPAARVERALRRAGFAGSRLRDLRVEQRSPSGRVMRLQVAGMRPDTVAGDDFRAAIGARELRSTAFTVTRAGRAFRFTGRGYGHGVGMCVVGAGRRAARGETAAQILERYFPGLALLPTAADSAPDPAAAAAAANSPAPGDSDPPAAEPAVAAAPHRGVLARVPPGLDRSAVERLAVQARDQLAQMLGVPAPAAITIDIHPSLDTFRHATGRPWWISTVVTGSTVDVAPAAIVSQHEGLEHAIRRGIVESLMSGSLGGAPHWVRVGAARYYASGRPTPAHARRPAPCPSDAELTMAVSAPVYRQAESRAEACFAAALARTGDWRAVR